MCGRYSLVTEVDSLQSRFGFFPKYLAKPRFNIAPGQQVPIISGEKRQLIFAKWGIVPHWVAKTSQNSGAINLHIESVGKSAGFSRLFKKNRCLFLADGFYLWRAIKKTKQPYYLQCEGKRPFVFAGLYDRWQDQLGQQIESAAIFTAKISAHETAERIPLIIDDENIEQWLAAKNLKQDFLDHLIEKNKTRKLKAYPISTQINDPSFDNEACVAPLV